MSRGSSSALTVAEKAFGLLLIAVGIWGVRSTWQSGEAQSFWYVFFLFFGLLLTAVGAFMVLAKTERT